MPVIMMGTAIEDRKGSHKELTNLMTNTVSFAIQNGIVGFDTARDYSNEKILGDIFYNLFSKRGVHREDIFVTTKIGNGQQYERNIQVQVEEALRALKLEYIDLMLLHWPLPGYYVDNWKNLCHVYKTGKVKAVGIANCRERHLLELERAQVEIMPHVVQIEYHPFRTVPKFMEMCKERKIQVEAYSANCVMLPFVRENPVLLRIANKYNKSITQIMMRWHIQQGTIPLFSSMSQRHIMDNINVFDFELDDEEMKDVFALNIDYKFHPESLNCPGY